MLYWRAQQATREVRTAVMVVELYETLKEAGASEQKAQAAAQAMAEAARREDWPRTVAEFEARHARRPEGWEFIDGQPRLMAPASMKHAIIKNNIGFVLRQAMADLGCTALIDGPQILTDEISAIPDVVVLQRHRSIDPRDRRARDHRRGDVAFERGG